MTTNGASSYVILAGFSLLAFLIAMGLGIAMKQRAIIKSRPSRYLPHFILLLTIALAPTIASGHVQLLRVAAVLGGVVVIWVLAVWLSSKIEKQVPRKLPNTR
jgi:hypothetical protein